jgi:hypothetical protein
MLVKLPIRIPGELAVCSHFWSTLLSRVMLTDNWGNSKKPPIPPVTSPAEDWIPKRSSGRKARLQARELKAADELKGRGWNVVLSLRSSQ